MRIFSYKKHRERAMPFPYIKPYKSVPTAFYSSFSAVGDFFDSLTDVPEGTSVSLYSLPINRRML